jgi:hypothetical protein
MCCISLLWVSMSSGEENYSNRTRILRPLNAKDRAIFSKCNGRKYTNKAYGEIPLRWPGTYKSKSTRQGTTKDRCLAHSASREDLWQHYSQKKSCSNQTQTLVIGNDVTVADNSQQKLLVCIGAHVDEEASFLLLMKSICSVKKFHGDSTVIFLFDNGSPHQYYQRIVVMAEYEDRIILQRAEESRWEWGAINASLHWAHNHGWNHFTHFAYLQHSMSLLQPLPLSSLGCPLVSYRCV